MNILYAIVSTVMEATLQKKLRQQKCDFRHTEGCQYIDQYYEYKWGDKCRSPRNNESKRW